MPSHFNISSYFTIPAHFFPPLQIYPEWHETMASSLHDTRWAVPLNITGGTKRTASAGCTAGDLREENFPVDLSVFACGHGRTTRPLSPSPESVILDSSLVTAAAAAPLERQSCTQSSDFRRSCISTHRDGSDYYRIQASSAVLEKFTTCPLPSNRRTDKLVRSGIRQYTVLPTVNRLEADCS